MTAKRHHYVPQHYLRRFMASGQRSDQLWCYDKTDGKVFKSNILSLAQEIGFYWFEIDGMKFSGEEWLAEIEGGFASSVEVLTRKGTASGLSEQERQQISLFVGLQELRTPRIRKLPAEFEMAIVDKWPAMKQAEQPLTPDELTAFHLGLIHDALPEVADIVGKLKWVLGHNGTASPLWTSDDPVFRYNKQDAGFFSNMGLTSPGIEVHCPINSEWLLLMCDNSLYSCGPDRMEMKQHHVLFENTGQVSHSRRYVFCSDNDFSVADEYLKQNPEYSDPHRSRVQVGW